MKRASRPATYALDLSPLAKELPWHKLSREAMRRRYGEGPDADKGGMLYASDRARAKRQYGEESEDALFMSKLLDSKNIAEVEDLDRQAAATPEASAGRAQGLRGHS